MGLPAATVWEVRPTAGSDNNGGGFVAGASGTDYSQQNAAQYSATDLVVDAVTNTKVSSVSHSFAAADVGNLLHVTAGVSWTAGFYQIVSVAAGAATLDRSPAATGTTGGTYAVGGALANISTAHTNGVPGNTVYVKATGSYTVSATLTMNKDNESGASVFTFIGYGTTRGDGSRVTWTTATNSVALLSSGAGHNYAFRNFNFTTTAGTPAAAIDGALAGPLYGLFLSNCKFSGGFVQGVKGAYNSGVNWDIVGLVMDSCEVTGCTSYGVGASGDALLFGCYIHGNTGNGVTLNSTGSSGSAGICLVNHSVIYNNGSSGIYLGNTSNQGGVQLHVINSAIVGNTSDGLTASPDYQPLVLLNSVIESNGGYGLNLVTSWGMLFERNNAWRSNTSGDALNFTKSSTDITLTAEPFTSPSGNDFTLNSTAGGGAACKAAGYQGTLYNATAAGNSIDIGPVQSASGGGGSTTNYIFALNKTQVMTEEFY